MTHFHDNKTVHVFLCVIRVRGKWNASTSCGITCSHTSTSTYMHVVYQKHQARCCKQRVSSLHVRGCLTIVSCSSGYTAVKPISKLGLCIHSDCVRCGRSKTSECIGTLRCCGDSLFGTTLWLVPHLIVV